ncbi:LppP/LprE family lipoprotein [Mycobacterium cookii]|uniref:LppP/LprE family lipoprotein n=1 Tax=Mycobacterium cookii TaxID=1775 RepID=UPI0015D4136E|nr:LppP/LprE family lipoprotein [Mycobacterium cookii]MCV7331431.1 LppP/LprE family lipoprotein [Mycobacterium cookii]
MWTRQRPIWRPVGLVAAAVLAATLSSCGSGDSTVAKTPQATAQPTATSHPAASPPPVAGATPTSSAPVDPCAVNLADPAIARGISELPHDPRSQQPWNPEPMAGNFNECAQLSAVIVKANTNAESPNTRAVMFHLGKLIPPQGVPDTYGFNGLDLSQCTGDTVALMYSGGIGLPSVVKFRWNGNGVELVANAGR